MKRNLSCLRFETDTDKLYRNVYDNNYAVQTPNRTMPPFQIIRPQRTNAITECKLVRKSDSTEIDILSLATGLRLQKSGYDENYTDSSLITQFPSESKTAFGWTLGDVDSLSKCEIIILADDANNRPTSFTARVATSYANAVADTYVLTSIELTNQVIPLNQNHRLFFDFNEEYDNSGGDFLWIEIRANGVFSIVGKTDVPFDPNDENVTFDTGTDYPDNEPETSTASKTKTGYVKSYNYLGNYDIIQYDGSEFAKFLNPGLYHCVISDGVDTWESEYFHVIHNLEQSIKLEWWHDRPFVFPNGHIRYDNNFKNILYLDASLNAPEYPHEEEVESRDGYEFVSYSITYKLFKFKAILPEYILDLLSVIRQHDHVKVYHNYDEYVVDTFLMTPGNTTYQWREADIEFRTDTVIVETGKGEMNTLGTDDVYKEKAISDITFSTYSSERVTCIPWDYKAVDEMLESDPEFTSYSGQTNDYVVAEDVSGDHRLYQWNGSSMILVGLSDYDVVKNVKGLIAPSWLYQKTGKLVNDNTISLVSNPSGDDFVVDGEAMPTARVRVEMESATHGAITYTQWYDGQHLIDDGIDFTHADIRELVPGDGKGRVRLNVRGDDCTFSNSSWYNVL